MTENEALRLALEALEKITVDVKTTPTAYEAQRQAITAIKEALAQPEQEPIGYASEGAAERLTTVKQAHEQIRSFRLFTHDVPLYTTPPQRTWVGLTDEQVIVISDYALTRTMAVQMTAATLKGKNSD